MKRAGRSEEEEGTEEVFLDACEDGGAATGASPDLPPLRRSARKRKSESEPATTVPTCKGKRPRPLGNGAARQDQKNKSMERTPDGRKQSARTPQTEKRSQNDQERQRQQQEQDPGPAPRTSTEHDKPEMMMFMGGIRTMMREELQKTENSIRGSIGVLDRQFKELREEVREVESRVESMDNRMEEKIEEIIATKYGSSLRNNSGGHWPLDGSNYVEMPSARDNRYWKSRRSLRMWPIRGDGPDMKTAVLTFLATKLRLGEDVISDAENCHIVRIPSAGGKNNKIKHEVVVEFPTVDLRDIVRKAAYNLAGSPESGLRLEVPHHLMKNFKALEATSYRLKQKYKAMKRNIKFDDECCDLVLEFKLHEDAPWKRLKPDQARELQREDGGAEEVSAADVTSLLGEEGDESASE